MTTPGRIRLKDAADRLGVHYITLRRWAREGMVTYWLDGKGRYMEFDPKDIEALDTSFRRDRAEPPTHWVGPPSGHITYMGVDLANEPDQTVIVNVIDQMIKENQ